VYVGFPSFLWPLIHFPSSNGSIWLSLIRHFLGVQQVVDKASFYRLSI
jgi:hypothetical protein